ncbi:6-phosphogluconolactonase [Algoriphagus aestuariicola]|uniref:6-phosphogluconolactonase n=1 Tax=Algoriphagus aestuariicola TaxID=1852016 RepID=A0ABS3BNI0_9BACT|nr:6-phosphogluconolactonase [Algoriphagus aestuariicola]MBN7800461.1 6-phosphogluconolactonase [Algoriphagus aestuariicola]
MKFHYYPDFETMSRQGFELVKDEIEAKPDLLFCVASGGSPSGLYAEMVKHRKSNPDFCSSLRVVKLDEWGGLEPGSTFTSEHDVQTKFVQPLEIASERYTTIDPFTKDPIGDCSRMKEFLEMSGPVDICILGIGVNSHIALNEPCATLTPSFHVCDLAESTLNNGMIKSLKQPPTFGMTMGVGEILSSRKILLFISGSGKKEAFDQLLKAEVSTQFPASLLWLHPNVDVLIDQRMV